MLVIMDHFTCFAQTYATKNNLPTLLLQSSSTSSSLDLGFPHACIMIRAKNLKTPFFVPWNSFVVSFIHKPVLITQKVMGRLRDSIAPSLPCYEPYQKRKSLNGQSISTRLRMHITAPFDVSKTKQPMNPKLTPLSSYQVTTYLFEIFQREGVQANFNLTGKKPFMWLFVD